MESLSVALGNRSYPVHIGQGLIDSAELYRPHVGPAAAIVTNSVVAPLYASRVRRALEACGARVVEVLVEDGEIAKSFGTLERLLDALLAATLGRDGLIVALGGGVIGDLAGFAAAIYQRGIDFVQIPTTLLAQVDSSVGGKTAINHERGKNLIGAFHQPRAVIADVGTLDTLPSRELRSGLAEVIKYGLALDPAFVEWLEQNVEKLIARDAVSLDYAVRRSCELKAAIVARDERETSGERALLNFGHTFGHAIETATGLTWLHGEAIAAGMVMAAELSARLGLVSNAELARARRLIARAGLPVKGPALVPEKLLEIMTLDKKAARGQVRFVLLESIGKARLRADVPERLVREAIVAAAQ
jgi:3-dehydroquinate synthase